MRALMLGRFCRITLDMFLVADVAHAAVAADYPDLGQFDDFLIGHQRIGEVCEFVKLARRDAVLASEDDVGETLRNDGARAWSTMKLSPMSQPMVMPSWKSEFIHG